MKKLYLLAKKGSVNEKAPLVDRQEVIVHSPIDKVWDTLADIGDWPQWNTSLAVTKIPSKFDEGQYFYWKRDGKRFKSSLVKINRPFTLAWISHLLWFRGIMVWKLRALDKWKTKVTVQQSQQGFLVSFFLSQEKLHKSLDIWLNLLKIRVERKYPHRKKPVQRPPKSPTGSNNDSTMMRGINMVA